MRMMSGRTQRLVSGSILIYLVSNSDNAAWYGSPNESGSLAEYLDDNIFLPKTVNEATLMLRQFFVLDS